MVLTYPASVDRYFRGDTLNSQHNDQEREKVYEEHGAEGSSQYVAFVHPGGLVARDIKGHPCMPWSATYVTIGLLHMHS